MGECPQELAFRISLSALQPRRSGVSLQETHRTVFAPGRSLLSESVPSGNTAGPYANAPHCRASPCSSRMWMSGCPMSLRLCARSRTSRCSRPGAPPSSPNPGQELTSPPGLADSPAPVTAWARLPASPGAGAPPALRPGVPLAPSGSGTGVSAHSLPGEPLLTAWPPPRARGCLSLSALDR